MFSVTKIVIVTVINLGPFFASKIITTTTIQACLAEIKSKNEPGRITTALHCSSGSQLSLSRIIAPTLPPPPRWGKAISHPLNCHLGGSTFPKEINGNPFLALDVIDSSGFTLNVSYLFTWRGPGMPRGRGQLTPWSPGSGRCGESLDLWEGNYGQMLQEVLFKLVKWWECDIFKCEKV